MFSNILFSYFFLKKNLKHHIFSIFQSFFDKKYIASSQYLFSTFRIKLSQNNMIITIKQLFKDPIFNLILLPFIYLEIHIFFIVFNNFKINGLYIRRNANEKMLEKLFKNSMQKE